MLSFAELSENSSAFDVSTTTFRMFRYFRFQFARFSDETSYPTQKQLTATYAVVMCQFTNWPILTSSRYFTCLKGLSKCRITTNNADRSDWQNTDRSLRSLASRRPRASIKRGSAHLLMSGPRCRVVGGPLSSLSRRRATTHRVGNDQGTSAAGRWIVSITTRDGQTQIWPRSYRDPWATSVSHWSS